MAGEESWGWTALDACVYGLVGALMLYILLQVAINRIKIAAHSRRPLSPIIFNLRMI
jgi:hypothetical protein